MIDEVVDRIQNLRIFGSRAEKWFTADDDLIRSSQATYGVHTSLDA